MRADGLIREPLILEFVGNVNVEMKSEIVKYIYIYICNTGETSSNFTNWRRSWNFINYFEARRWNSNNVKTSNVYPPRLKAAVQSTQLTTAVHRVFVIYT